MPDEALNGLVCVLPLVQHSFRELGSVSSTVLGLKELPVAPSFYFYFPRKYRLHASFSILTRFVCAHIPTLLSIPSKLLRRRVPVPSTRLLSFYHTLTCRNERSNRGPIASTVYTAEENGGTLMASLLNCVHLSPHPGVCAFVHFLFGKLIRCHLPLTHALSVPPTNVEVFISSFFCRHRKKSEMRIGCDGHTVVGLFFVLFIYLSCLIFFLFRLNKNKNKKTPRNLGCRSCPVA